ncbi:hypothetical protein HD554DRAFT_1983217, partial [Boletus coccyginus]
VTNSVSTQEPASALVTAEPVINEMRKGFEFDTVQLEVLNEAHARKAFPSPDEYVELARKLNTTRARVLLWFVKKRLSVVQSRTVADPVKSGTCQPFSIPSQSEDIGHSPYGG